MDENQVLCACSAYEQKFYLNPRYESLPEGIKEELKILSVMLTADVGGVFTMEFEEDGSLYMSTTAKENDFFYDEIGSYLKIKQMRQEHEELFSSLEEYYRAFFAGKEEYKPVIIQTAKSLSTRFRPAAGVLQSWDADKGWQAERGWKCPVIIDNMMNLELLFEASKLSGDSTYYNVAVKHADTTMKNHFRANNSCYHVVDYDPVTGEVRKKQTAQGYADESAWARGQAWAIYGYTMCYRYTHDQKYLDMAEKIYNFIFNNPNLPEDLVPYWDFDAPNIPNEPRDVSAAACTASALYELSTYIPGKNYKETADKIMENLASPAYRAEVGTNGNFILMHSVGSIPHGAEIDVPLNYADYYFLEGIMRKRDLESNKKLF